MICNIQCQKMIAYAILGYVDFVKRKKVGDIEINMIFGPLGMIDDLEEAGIDESIIAALRQIDEIDVLMELGGPKKFDQSIIRLVDPILLFLSRDSVDSGKGTYAIRKLLVTE